MDYTHWLIVGAGVAGLALLIVAALVFIRTRDKSKAMESARTIGAAEAWKVASPAGTQVELKGTAETDAPLAAPASGTPCVYYRHKVEELHVYYDYDRQYGGSSRREDWQTVSDDSRYVPFWLRDSSGAIQVIPQDAEIVARQNVDHEYGSGIGGAGDVGGLGGAMGGGGGVMGNILGMGMSGDTGQRRQSEWVIATKLRVYVLGAAFQTSSGPVVKKGEGPFIVSSKSEEELGESYQRRSTWTLVAGCVAGAAGIAGILYAAANSKKVFEGSTVAIVAGAVGLAFLFGIGWGLYQLVKGGSFGAGLGTSARDGSLEAMMAHPESAAGGMGATGAGPAMMGAAPAVGAVEPLSQLEPVSPPVPIGAPEPFVAQEPPAPVAPAAPAVAEPQAPVGVIQHDIVIGGAVAFKAGERVHIEGESPDPDRPDYKYIVLSTTLNKKFRLSDLDVFL